MYVRVPFEESLLTNNGFKLAKDVDKSDLLVSMNGTSNKIKNIQISKQKVCLFNTEICSILGCSNIVQKNNLISFINPIEYKKKNLALHPYVLGVLLGDGSFGERSISFSSKDEYIVNSMQDLLVTYDCEIRKSQKYSYTIKYKFNKSCLNRRIAVNDKIFSSIKEGSVRLNVNKGTLYNRCLKELCIDNKKYKFLDSKVRVKSNPIVDLIKGLNLYETKAHDKFIPDDYKYSSIEDRIFLIRGLLDTDGTIGKKYGNIYLTTVSHKLAEDFCEIVRSVGNKATVFKRDRRSEKPRSLNGRLVRNNYIAYECYVGSKQNINLFNLPRKKERFKIIKPRKLKILSVNEVGIKNVICFECQQDTFLGKNFIPFETQKE